MQAAIRSHFRIGKVSQAVALSPGPMPAEVMIEFSFDASVENQGRNSDPNRARAASMPTNSPTVSLREVDEAALLLLFLLLSFSFSALVASIPARKLPDSLPPLWQSAAGDSRLTCRA